MSQLVTKKNKLLNEFCAEDITNIVGIVASEGHVAVNQSKQLGIAKYLPFFSMLFIVAMIASNIGYSKLASIFGITITGGMLSFSFSYAISDIITEVYGFKRARQLIWGSLVCNVFLMSLLAVTIYAPPSAYWHNQASFESVLLSVPRIRVTSLISYGTGEFVNSYILAKLKIKKKNLLVRIIYSSMVGIVADTMIFSFIAFLGTIPLNLLM